MFNYQEEHKKLCDLMHEIYIKKNSDYGNSFSDLYDEYGSIISEIHIREKFNRFKQLRTNESQVGESIEDTLMDMANYCLLTLLEMKKLNSYIDEEVIEENIELEEVQEEVQDSTEDVTEEMISDHLMTGHFKYQDPDLLIRTSGEQRISNFLLWQLAYSELAFSDKNWPDFDEDDLKQFVNDYKHRNRRFGKVDESDS